ncbi:Uncharacterized protein dnm_075320 [Desulfonema magnum]|uniref:Uncharacterized protein n=1 Tax=Desulfonema magnum TaxID=45655 RepID=A0A975BUM8_9BACT|nr:Uncharacterized protein dnm_075320 [Desulfonema magnum]
MAVPPFYHFLLSEYVESPVVSTKNILGLREKRAYFYFPKQIC